MPKIKGGMILKALKHWGQLVPPGVSIKVFIGREFTIKFYDKEVYFVSDEVVRRIHLMAGPNYYAVYKIFEQQLKQKAKNGTFEC
jgi:hypothetical protein